MMAKTSLMEKITKAIFKRIDTFLSKGDMVITASKEYQQLKKEFDVK